MVSSIRALGILLSALSLSSGFTAAQEITGGGMERVDRPPVIEPDRTNPSRAYPLMVGDPMPPIEFKNWIVGDPFVEFEKGKVYVIDLWATWCDPCIGNMPKLTALQNEFADQGLVVMGITSPGTINRLETAKEFVFSQTSPIGYTIVWDSSRISIDNWLAATGRTGIPHIFIVDQEGRLAFVGQPADFERPLRQIMAEEYDIELAARHYADDLVAGWGFQHYEQLLKSGEYVQAYNVARQFVDGKEIHSYGVLSNFAWSIVDPKSGPEVKDLHVALRAAIKANELTDNKDPDTIDTLARVYFCKGDHAEAVKLQRQAVDLARTPKQKVALQSVLDEYLAASVTNAN